jgi:hypothetical protein
MVLSPLSPAGVVDRREIIYSISLAVARLLDRRGPVICHLHQSLHRVARKICVLRDALEVGMDRVAKHSERDRRLRSKSAPLHQPLADERWANGSIQHEERKMGALKSLTNGSKTAGGRT